MKLISLLLVSIITIAKVISEDVEWIGSGINYQDSSQWSNNMVPGINDDATIDDSFVVLDGASNLWLPKSLLVNDNTVFEITNSQLLLNENSSLSISESTATIENTQFLSEYGSNGNKIIIDNSQVAGKGLISLINIEELKIKDTLFSSYTNDLENRILLLNSNLVLTGSTNLVFPINCTSDSSLMYIQYTPQEYGVNYKFDNIISGNLTISQSNLLSRNNFKINSKNSRILIKDESFLVISEEYTTFSHDGLNFPNLLIDGNSMISVESYEINNEIGLEVNGGSNLLFADSIFKFNVSAHTFSTNTRIDFKGSEFDLSNTGGKGLNITNINLFDYSSLSFKSLDIELGIVQLQNSFLRYDGIDGENNQISIKSVSFIQGLGNLNLTSISLRSNVRIESLLPLIINYGVIVSGKGELKSRYIVNYGTFGTQDSISNIKIDGTLLQDDENESKLVIRVNSQNEYSTVNINGDLNINNSTLRVYYNSSLTSGTFSIINFNSIVANSTLFRDIRVYSVEESKVATEISTGYLITYTSNSIDFVLIDQSSSSNSASASSSASSSEGSESSENSSTDSSSSASSSSQGSESSESGSSEGSESNENSSTDSSSSGSSSQGSESSENGSSSDSWESSSSDDYQVVCSFNPVKNVLHVINHGDEKIVCTGYGNTYCRNKYFECETEQNKTTVKCSTWNTITCIGRHVSCNVGKIINCNTNLNGGYDTPVPTQTVVPTSTPSNDTTQGQDSNSSSKDNSVNDKCKNPVKNSYCYNGNVYCLVPFTGDDCSIIIVGSTSLDLDSSNQSSSSIDNYPETSPIESAPSSSSKLIISTITISSLLITLINLFIQ